MDTPIYLGTAALTILWSVWIYQGWSQRARLRESDTGRFYHIIAPSGYFVLLALAGWERARVIRLDLIGVVAYDGIIVLCALCLLVVGALRHVDFRRAFRRILVLYNVLSLLLLVGLYLVKFFPPLLIRFTALVQQLTEMEFFRLAWVGLDPESHEQDLVSMANKVLIALLSYIPVSLARALYISRQMSRQRREMHAELARMHRRLETLENKLKAEAGVSRPAAAAAPARAAEAREAGQREPQAPGGLSSDGVSGSPRRSG